MSDGEDWSGVYRFPLDGGPAERVILADTGATVLVTLNALRLLRSR